MDFSTDEIINFIDSNYSFEQQKDILQIFYRLGHTVEHSALIDDLLKKNIIKISDNPYISYRLEKFFDKKSINKISERKEFIFSKVPNLDGLKRGKSANYQDLLEYISKNHIDIFNELLSDFPVYSFSEPYEKNGLLFTKYLNRKINTRNNYTYNEKQEKWVIIEDEITNLLRHHNVQFEVENPEELFTHKINCTIYSDKMHVWKVILLIVLWPIGLYYLYKKYRSTND